MNQQGTKLQRQAKSFLRQGFLDRAERICHLLLKANPDDAISAKILAEINSRRGKYERSVKILGAAVIKHRRDSQTLLQLGSALKASGRLAEAFETCNRLTELAPEIIEAWLLRGEVLLGLGRLDDATTAFTAALELDLDHVDALLLRGATLQALARQDEALADYDRVIALQPRCADAFNNVGLILAGKGEPAAALASYDKALAINPDFAEALNNRGVALKRLGRNEDALASFKKAIALKPDYLAALRNQPDLLAELKRDADALVWYDHALVIAPDDPILHNNRGAMLQQLGRYQESLASYARAIELRPDYPDALNNRGTALEALGDFVSATKSIREALRLDPDKVSAHWNLSLCLLRQGLFEEGWREHEWRWKKAKFAKFIYDFPQPRWTGREDLRGRTVLLTAEQGFGDSIQFVRYARLLEKRGAKLLLFVPETLADLFSASFPAATVLSKVAKFPPFDFHCPLLSLPLAFGTRADTVPAAVPYLKAPLSRLITWEARIPPAEIKQIGLVWAGNPTHANDANRSMPIAALEPLLRDSDARFIVLQKEVSAADRQALEKLSQVTILGDQFKDFADTAAVISQLDLVITVDTAVAHLAGALGKPVWILLPFAADWRWLAGRTDSPWYPTARIYFQIAAGNWDSVIKQVVADFQAFLRTPRTATPTKPGAVSTREALKAAAVLHNSGNLTDAIAIYQGVLLLQPDDFDANNMLGVARLKQKRFDEAAKLICVALEQRPDNLVALRNLARALLLGGKHESAVATYERLTALVPVDAEAWSGRAVSLIALTRYTDALASVDQALALKSNHLHALNNRGVVLNQLRRHDEALVSLDQAVKVSPGFADAISNRGLALLALNRPQEAVANYREGLCTAPRSATLLNNLGISLVALNQLHEATSRFDQAIAMEPTHVDANWNQALTQLALGNFERGWHHYEWRWKRPEFSSQKREFHLPQWTGEQDLKGKTVFLYSEQGFGDALQFVRYIRPLEAMGANIQLGVPESLRVLMTSSFPAARVFSGMDILPPFDLHCPLLSLPLAFGTTVETIPSANPPYLRAPVERLEAWARRLPAGKELKVGLAWSGNAAHTHDRNRSLSIDSLRPLLALSGMRFYGLQKDVRVADLEALKILPQLELLGAEFEDFADTAAAVAQMDLVISVDTSIAHLAGGMGKPVWVWLPFAADWRWMIDREDSPWYPTARLFRQSAVMAVSELVERTCVALKLLASPTEKTSESA